MYDVRRTMVFAVSVMNNDLTGPPREMLQLADVLHALSDPVRLGIVCGLDDSGGERRCGSFGAPVTKSTLTHHFRVLREAGMICQRQEGDVAAEPAPERRPRGALPGGARCGAERVPAPQNCSNKGCGIGRRVKLP